MSDIRKYINLVESAQTAEVDEAFGQKPKETSKRKSKELGTDYYGHTLTAFISMHLTHPEWSNCDIITDDRRNTVARIFPDSTNPTADLKGAWVIKRSTYEQYSFIKEITCESLTKAMKEVVNQLKTEQREISDERSYGRGRDGERF